MKYDYWNDLKKRIFFKKLEFFKLICVFLVCSNNIEDLDRYKIYINFIFNKKTYINFNLKNHCLLTRHSKVVTRFTSLTRSHLKMLTSWGYLNGLRKGSW